MPAPIPVELRQVACRLVLSGKFTLEQVVELLEGYGSTASIKRWLKQLRETGSLEPRPNNPGPKPLINDEWLGVMHAIVEERPECKLKEIAEEFTLRTGQSISTSSVSRALASLGLKRKKNAWGREKKRRANSCRFESSHGACVDQTEATSGDCGRQDTRYPPFGDC